MSTNTTEKGAPVNADNNANVDSSNVHTTPDQHAGQIHEAPTGQSEPVVSPITEPAPVHQAQPEIAPAPSAAPATANDGLPNYEQAKNLPYGQPAAAMNQGAMVVPLNQLQGESPQPIDCPFCHRRTTTTITKEGSSMQM